MFQNLFGGSSTTGGLNLGSLASGLFGVKDLSCIGSQAFPESRYNELKNLMMTDYNNAIAVPTIANIQWFINHWSVEIAAGQSLVTGYKSTCSKEWHNKLINDITATITGLLSNYNYTTKTTSFNHGYVGMVNYTEYFLTSEKNPVSYTPVYTPTMQTGNVPQTTIDANGSQVVVYPDTTQLYYPAEENSLTLPGSGSVTLGNTTLGWGSQQIKPVWLLAGAGALILLLMKKK